MDEPDPLALVDVATLPFPVLFAYHHLLQVGCDALHVPPHEPYRPEQLFVRRSQLSRAQAALEEMVAGHRRRLARDARRTVGEAAREPVPAAPDADGGAEV